MVAFFVVQGASKVALKSFQSCYYYSFLSFFCDILWMFFLPIQLGKWKLDRKVVLTSEYYKQFEPWNGQYSLITLYTEFIGIPF